MGDPCCMWRQSGMIPGTEKLVTSADISLPGVVSSRSSRPSCSVAPDPIAQVEIESGANKVLLKWPSDVGCVCRSSLVLSIQGTGGVTQRQIDLNWGLQEVVLCPDLLPEIEGAAELSISAIAHNLHSAVGGPNLTLAIDRSSAATDSMECTLFNQTILAMPEDDAAMEALKYEWDVVAVVLLGVGCLLPFLTYGIVNGVAKPRSSLYRKLFRPWLMKDFTIGNILAFIVLIGVLVAFVALFPTDPDYFLANTFGNLAGCIGGLPMLWAMYGKTRVISLLNISLEYSWRIHAVLGFLFMTTAIVHGCLEITAHGFDYITGKFFNLMGLIAAILILIGSEFATLHAVMPKIVKYDWFKVMHFAAPLGYVFALIHLLKRSPALFFFNLIMLVLWIASKAQDMTRGGKTSVKQVKDVNFDYLAMTFQKSKFACKPGQFIRLSIPGQAVAHPFTVVPSLGDLGPVALDSGDGCFRLIIRTGAEGTFTHHLRAKATGGELSTKDVHIAGPYGEGLPKSLNSMAAYAFVMGGVGITPALSLIPALLRRTPAPDIRLIWFLRNEDLAKECLPYLQMLPEQHRTISISRQVKIGDWIKNTQAEFAKAGHQMAGMFVCGPASMSSEALKNSSQGPFVWHYHTEVFRFLLGA